MANTKLKFYLLITIIIIMLVGSGLYIDKLIRDKHITSSKEKVSHSLNHVSNQLILNLYKNIHIVRGLPALFSAFPSLPVEDFTTAAQVIINNQNQIRNIGAAPNLVIKYMYPAEGNEAAIGLDYRTKPGQLQAVLKAKYSKELSLAGPLELVQGGTGLISRIPVYLKNDTGNDSFWGIISVVIDENKLYKKSGLFSPNLDIEIAIRGKDGLGEKGEVFFGDPELFKQKHIGSTISLPNGSWKIVAKPREGWTSVPEDVWQQRFYIILAAVLLFILLFAFIKALMNAATANLKFKQFLEETPVPYILNSDRREIQFMNAAFTELFGYKLDDILTNETWWLKAFPDINYREHIHSQWDEYREEFKSSGTTAVLPLEVDIRCKNGETKTVLISLSRSHNDYDPITFYDITERKQAEMVAKEKIEDLAFYDPLTRLPNRRLLIDRLNHAIAASVRSDNEGSLLFLDLDHFKILNDTLGHDMGDTLLQQVASRLKSCMREGDTVARFGGDEFVILLENLNKDPEHAVSETEEVARKVLAVLNQPYQLGSHEYSGSVSIGSTLFDKNKPSVEELLKQADIAMYQAKNDGRNAFRIFDPHMQTAITTRVALENELQLALDSHQFHLYYQVQINDEHQVLGAEALIRWIHPERGLISPCHFITLAEETGLIIPIGNWVLNTACRQLKFWQKNELTQELTLSVNVSAKQLRQKNFVSETQAIVQLHNINPTRLKLELTESLLLDNVDDTIVKMISLAEMGIRFSLDDFGTGYSSLQYLKQLPLYQLKIDQSFIRDIASDNSDQAIVKTIIAMAQSLGLNVIAEGVETQQQVQLLLEEGCHQFQGYLFSQPIPIDEFEALLSKLHPK